jgi:hypothetical protein
MSPHSSLRTLELVYLASLARLLPERDPHEDIYEMLDRTLNDFDDIGEAAIHTELFRVRSEERFQCRVGHAGTGSRSAMQNIRDLVDWIGVMGDKVDIALRMLAVEVRQ